MICAVVGLGTFAWSQPAADPNQEWEELSNQTDQAYQAGDYASASRLAEQAYQFTRKAFGDRDPRTFQSLDNLARLYAVQGRYAEAEPLQKEALQRRREVLGPRHPDIFQSLDNLASLYHDQGRYAEAEPLYQEALQLRREVLGPRHPDTLASLNNLAALYHDQNRYAEAEPLQKEALQLHREVLGPRHPDTLTGLNNLANLYASQGRYAEAEPLHKEALRLSREVLGLRHPDTLTGLNNLAALYHDQNRYAEAEPLLKEVLQLRREMLGPRHPHTLISLNNLARLYDSQGRYAEAEPLHKEALQLRREMLGPRHPDTLTSLGSLALLYKNQGRYAEAEPLYQEALRLSREVLGPRHPDTLTSLNNLAWLYTHQGRYAEAEPMHKEALQLSREVLGPRHPHTLTSLANLARLYAVQGRYAEAEPLQKEALQRRREVLGPRHPDIFQSLDNLASLYHDQGRYAEAEPLYQEALQLRREVLGPRHPDTLTGLNNLANLYASQDRYVEAEPLYQEALRLSREVLGPRHPDTLTGLNNLANLYASQGRYAKAEPLHKEALQLRREVLGPRHPNTLNSLNNLAALYHDQNRYAEAELLHKEALQLRREVLGPRHPDTLTSLSNLARLYASQGRYAEAEPLYQEALQLSREVLGPRHPDALGVQLDSVYPLVNLGRSGEAMQRLREMEPQLLAWIGNELFSTEAERVRRHLVVSKSAFQDTALSLALREPSAAARQLAGTVMLRWKHLQGEEEAYLARLVRRSEDPRVRTLAQEIATLRARLSTLTREDKSDEAVKVLAELEAKELKLGQVSRDYQDYLRVRTANLDEVRAVLGSGAGLVEFRQYWPVGFRTYEFGEPRWAALLLVGFEEPILVDAGPVSETRAYLPALVGNTAPAESDKAAQALYQTLFSRLEPQLAGLKVVYLAPDGDLNLVPFSRLKLPDGQYWEERQAVRLLQTGRDLVRPDPDRPARGLLALGGIDFNAESTVAEAQPAKPAEAEAVIAAAEHAALGPRGTSAWQDARSQTRDTFRAGWKSLPASAEEIERVATSYRLLRRDESVEIWSGVQASEDRLKVLPRPPRVLHLATHGFYLSDTGKLERPMLFSGIALAGANRALTGSGEDGILYSLEAQGLNLEGTELVVLSACDTAQGSLDYGEGVYGLVRALRIAGARQVLVTLWPVNDGEARDFMAAFYRNWLDQDRSDPAAALRQTRLAYITDSDSNLNNPRVWAPYVLVGQ